MTVSHGAEHFRRLYACSADPWGIAPVPMSRTNNRRTIAALGERRFRSGFEPGCSIVVLTRMLATRCDALLAADTVEEPLHAARTLCHDLPRVRFVRLHIPTRWPHNRFDLIVLSEVLYLLCFRDIATVAALALAAPYTDGVVLLVNWLGPGDDPCGGDVAATMFLNQTHRVLRVASHYHTAQYRSELLVRR